MKTSIKLIAPVLVCLMLFKSFNSNAQFKLTAQQIESYLPLQDYELKAKLLKQGCVLYDKHGITANAVQFTYTVGNYGGNPLIIVYRDGNLGSLSYFTTSVAEYNAFKSTLTSRKFVYNRTLTSPQGKSLIIYEKEGGMLRNGLDVTLSKEVKGNTARYHIDFNNYHTDTETITSLSDLPKPIDALNNNDKIKKYQVSYYTGQQIFDWYAKYYKAEPSGDEHSFYMPLNGDNRCILVHMTSAPQRTVILRFSNECDD